ncbi:MAG: hypothetical protein ACYDH9_16760 [Limisphaerales bacterium]
MNFKCLNLSGLIALIGAGACLLGEISNRDGASTAAAQSPAASVAATPSLAARKAQDGCPVCAAQSTSPLPPQSPCANAPKANCQSCESKPKLANPGH